MDLDDRYVQQAFLELGFEYYRCGKVMPEEFTGELGSDESFTAMAHQARSEGWIVSDVD